MQKIPCACGCGTLINEFDKKNRKRTYSFGHHHKGKSNWWKKKEFVKKRTSHERANKICPKEKCEINNTMCSKKLAIHHIDGNPFNNRKENLVCLCGTHHFLLHKKRISINELFDLECYTYPNGKRKCYYAKNSLEHRVHMKGSQPRIILCPSCKKQQRHYSKGYCKRCYETNKRIERKVMRL